MKRAVRITGYILGGLVGLLVLAAAGVYTASEATIRRTYDVPLASLVVPQDAADIVEGERLARIRGCFGGCHGTTLEGRVFFDEPGVATIPAPNLTRVVREYSDAELEWGRYLVRTVCTECHGHDLRGDASGSPPDLRIAAAFDEAGWFELMRSGRGLGGRELDLMARVALSRFS
jgi:cytochrome c553